MTQPPQGFDFRQAGDEVVIEHHGQRAATLRGNERTARDHPRNRRR